MTLGKQFEIEPLDSSPSGNQEAGPGVAVGGAGVDGAERGRGRRTACQVISLGGSEREGRLVKSWPAVMSVYPPGGRTIYSVIMSMGLRRAIHGRNKGRQPNGK